MKRISFFNWGKGIVPLLGLLMVLSFAPFLSRTTYADDFTFSLGIGGGSTDDVSYLAQYGNWTDVEPYGSVWVPNVSSDWRPFTYGHWTWTDQGWAWVSYEPYGWLVFHYGNWDYRQDIGWFWIEGSQWSPARVEWLNYDNYCAWAPMPPVGVSWDEPWQSGGLHFWVMVRDRDLDRENIGHYGIHRAPVPRGPESRDVYHRPLGIHEFERITGHRVEPHALQRGPAQVYMNPRNRGQRRAEYPGEQPQERRNEPRAQGPEHRGNQPEARPGENRGGESHQGEAHQAEGRAGEYRHDGNGSEAAPHAGNRPEENGFRQLQRMILPRQDQNKVDRNRPRFEHKVMNQNNENRNRNQENRNQNNNENRNQNQNQRQREEKAGNREHRH